jgi:hypothetical protein
LDRELVGGGWARPGDGNAGERFGDEEAVPGAELPGAMRVDVAGADGSVDELSELGRTGLGDHGGAAGAVGGDGAVVAGEVGTLHVAQTGSAVAGAGAADGDEAEAFDGAGDEFAVEAAADEDGEAVVAEAPGAGNQTAVPEGVDGGGRDLVAVCGSRLADVVVAKGDAEATDNHARQTGDDGEGYALLKGVGGDHFLSLPFEGAAGVVSSQLSVGDQQNPRTEN